MKLPASLGCCIHLNFSPSFEPNDIMTENLKPMHHVQCTLFHQHNIQTQTYKLSIKNITPNAPYKTFHSDPLKNLGRNGVVRYSARIFASRYNNPKVALETKDNKVLNHIPDKKAMIKIC